MHTEERCWQVAYIPLIHESFITQEITAVLRGKQKELVAKAAALDSLQYEGEQCDTEAWYKNSSLWSQSSNGGT